MPQWSWSQWGAIAASLLIGAMLGPLWLRAPTAPVLRTQDGQLLAEGTLAQALSQQLASGQPRDAAVQIGISFRAHDGGYCRTFMLRERSALAGLACRDQGRWRLQALGVAQAPPASSGDYRPAGAPLPPAVTRAVDELIEGEPLDARAETAARSRGWQP